MTALVLVCAGLAGVLAVIELVRTKAQALVAWGVLALAVALAAPRIW